jgi:uncharacterized Zn finger protein (UPF0148 family)
MKQITLAIIFVALMFGTSFAFDCPKCKAEMTEEEDKYICPKCGSIVPITRTKIYNEPTVEKKIGTDVEEKGRKSQELDENLIKDTSKVNKDVEYNSKIQRINELKNSIERLEEELSIVEDEIKKAEWERPPEQFLTDSTLERLKGRKEGIQGRIRKYELEIETIKRSL